MMNEIASNLSTTPATASVRHVDHSTDTKTSQEPKPAAVQTNETKEYGNATTDSVVVASASVASATTTTTTTTSEPLLIMPSFTPEQINQYRVATRTARTFNDNIVYLDGPLIYSCYTCHTQLACYDDIISKSFHGRHGRAYLFHKCVNVQYGTHEDRRLLTGLHTVCDISCIRCHTVLGWTYLKAYEENQKYKEGKYIIEKIHLHLEQNGSSLYYDDYCLSSRNNHASTSYIHDDSDYAVS